MSATPREIVAQTLAFENPPRAPRDLWFLPIAKNEHPEACEVLDRDYPSDIHPIGGRHPESPLAEGDPHEIGTAVDAWGCTFVNVQRGVHGEVKDPLVKDWEADREKIRFPREWLQIDTDDVARECDETDKYTRAGCMPRPFERLQFLRGTEGLYMDLMDPSDAFLSFMKELHAFNCEQVELWARTPVDSIGMMDDWGAQNALLISPNTWREFFRPMYKDFVDITHGAGKTFFMHSDGHILAIYPDLIEIGVDALNSQLFCMGIENLEPYAGKITFWGEIDRQHLLPFGSRAEIDAAVKKVHASLWRNGGCFAQCEFGAGSRPENVRQVFESWDAVTQGE